MNQTCIDVNSRTKPQMWNKWMILGGEGNTQGTRAAEPSAAPPDSLPLTSPLSLSACRLTGLLLGPRLYGLREGTRKASLAFSKQRVFRPSQDGPTGFSSGTCGLRVLTLSWQSLQDAATGCGQVSDGLPLLLGRIRCFWEDYEGHGATFIQHKRHISALSQIQKSCVTLVHMLRGTFCTTTQCSH